MPLSWVAGQIKNQNNFSKSGFFKPTFFFLFQAPGLQRSQTLKEKSQQTKMEKKTQHKLPCFREYSWGPLIYSSAEQTEHLCSSFASSPKQQCQKLKFAFLTLFILRGKLFLQRIKASLPDSKFLSGSGLDSKEKEACVAFPVLLNKPSKGNSLIPSSLNSSDPIWATTERESGRNCAYSPAQLPGGKITGSIWET